MPGVVIKLRDLDTDERTESVVDVERIPANELRREQELAEIVQLRHPEARQRSFAGGVASFVDRRHLIIARYLGSPSPVSEAVAEDESRQDQLFAA